MAIDCSVESGVAFACLGNNDCLLVDGLLSQASSIGDDDHMLFSQLNAQYLLLFHWVSVECCCVNQVELLFLLVIEEDSDVLKRHESLKHLLSLQIDHDVVPLSKDFLDYQ